MIRASEVPLHSATCPADQHSFLAMRDVELLTAPPCLDAKVPRLCGLRMGSSGADGEEGCCADGDGAEHSLAARCRWGQVSSHGEGWQPSRCWREGGREGGAYDSRELRLLVGAGMVERVKSGEWRVESGKRTRSLASVGCEWLKGKALGNGWVRGGDSGKLVEAAKACVCVCGVEDRERA